MTLVVENLPTNAGDMRDVGSIPGLGRYPAGGLMATHSSILAWRIPWTEEPGRLQSTGLHRIRMTEATSSVTGDPMISAETALKTNKQTKNFYFSDQLRIKSFLAFKINVKDNLKILASNVCSLK